jgi:hypothetical protein
MTRIPTDVAVAAAAIVAAWGAASVVAGEPALEAAQVTTPAEPVRRMQVAPTLPPPPLPIPHYDEWIALARCESGGNWSINTGNGYYGGLQFALTSWRAVGGSGYPHQHSPAEQMLRAERLLDLQGWGAWPTCSRKVGLR